MFATVEKSSLFYTEEGSQNKTTVIFLHGFPFSHEMWKEQLNLLGKNYRAISYDIRGHGKSDSGDGLYSVDSHVDDLFGLMNHLHIQKAVIAGLSMGGYIALRAVERKPEAFSGLILCDTKSEADGNEAKIKRFQSVRDMKISGVTDAFTEGYLKNVFTTKSMESNTEAVKMIRRTIKTTSAMGIAANFLALASRTDTTESLSKIKIPTLILVGEKDIVTTPANAASLHEKIKGSTLTIVPDAAHMSNLENPSVFNEQLLQFLSNIHT
jgi:3-oxoadipate enol-lactonase